MESIKAYLVALDSRSRVALVIGASVIVLATVAAVWWVFSPGSGLLFGNLREADAAEISAALDEWKVNHTFTDDGSGILVDDSQLHAVRMRLVAAGIPKGGHVGYELFDDNEFGVTEFAQRINYQRALQGELERTIITIPGVQNVRVHLSIRRPGLFISEQADSKASVAVTLLPGASLERKQVAGIRNLVASAVEGLKPEAVVVVGPSGLQLAGPSAVETQGLATDQSDAARQMADDVETKLEQLLSEALHGEQALVSVHIRLNFDQIRMTSERVLAQPGQETGLVVRRTGNGSPPSEAGGQSLLVNEHIEYAHGKEREEITRASGTVERISVAVVLPGFVTPAEQDRLRRLVFAAAGLDDSRGDTLEIGLAPARETHPARAGGIPVGNDDHPDAATPSTINVATLPNPAYLWAALTWLVGITMGAALISLRRRRRQPRLLTAEESEAAVLKVRAWLSGPSP